jgi:hypothetical protein
MSVNSLGLSSASGSGTQGPAGPPGRGISSVTFVDNNDGSVTLTFNMSDGTTEGPFTSTLVSDDLISLNELTLTGANLATKLNVVNNSGTTIFGVNTVNGLLITSLAANSLVQTNSSSQLIASNALPSSLTITSATLSSPTLSGTVATSLTVSSLVQTNASGNLIASNTLPSSLSLSSSTLSDPTVTGTVVYNSNNSSWLADGTHGFAMPPITKYYYQYTFSGILAANANISLTLPSGKTPVNVMGLRAMCSITADVQVSNNYSFNPAYEFNIIADSNGGANTFTIYTGSSWGSITNPTFYIWLEST